MATAVSRTVTTSSSCFTMRAGATAASASAFDFSSLLRATAMAAVDKRVLLIAGRPVPYCLARVPRPGETRGNLAAGAIGIARELTTRDREIAEAMGPALHREGLLLVGLDVIGDYLTEVNVTSPTCFVEIAEQTGFNVAGMMLDSLEKAVAG